MEETVEEYDLENTSIEVDVYSESGTQELVDADEMSPEEEAFMRGYGEDL